MDNDTKKCRACDKDKNISQFNWKTSAGKKYRQSYCKPCLSAMKKLKPRTSRNPEVESKWSRINCAKEKLERANGFRPEYYILKDSRSSDRRKKRENDLDQVFIAETIKKGCAYCGDHSNKMSLDRIDNSIGHIKLNVVPACLRCNLIRGNMPYHAWLYFVDVCRLARENGAFGEWNQRSSQQNRE